MGDPRPRGWAFGSFPKLIRGGKDARSCGSIVEGSAAPTSYDSGPVDAKGRHLDESDNEGLHVDAVGDFGVVEGSHGRSTYQTIAQAPDGPKYRR